MIEVHDTPQNLYDYRNTIRPQKANIIIRRQHVGAMSNDMGFIKQEDGTYKAIIDQFSQGIGYGASWLNKLQQTYNLKVVEKVFKKQNKKFTQQKLKDGTIKLSVAY